MGPTPEQETRQCIDLVLGGAGWGIQDPAAMIAAALVQDAPLATGNRTDFAPFVPLGLELAG